MKLSIEPTGLPGGSPAPVPAGWTRHLISWASPEFYKYDFGSVLVQEYETAHYSFYSWRVKANKQVKLYPTCERPTLALQFMLQGNISCVLSGYGEKDLFEHHYEFFYVPVGVQEAVFEEGEYHTLHIELDEALLQEGIHLYPALEKLVRRMQENSTQGGFVGPFPLDYRTRHLVLQLQQEPRTDALPITLQKYIFDLLYEYLQQLEAIQAPKKLTVLPHMRLLEKLQAHIRLAPNIHQHSVKQLARWSTMSATQLKALFREFVGVPLATYVRQQALEKAHWLVIHTSISLDDIAEEVGYSSASNLNQAFKMQFGYLPATLRKGHTG